jgi:mono/diheme cytochrome c family protein
MSEANELPPLLGEPEREDIHQIHDALLSREPREPEDGSEPAPWWVWAVSVTVLFAMGVYLGRYGGSFSADPHELYMKAPSSAQAASKPAVSGQAVYTTVCMPCHNEGGAGVEGRYPPLAGSEWVAREDAIRFVLHGRSGPIEVKGKRYVGEMPALGGQLTDAEIAAVVNYVRQNWGNKGPAVDEATVAKLRGEK